MVFMAYTIGYLMDKKVVRISYDGDLTQEDALTSNVEAIELIRAGNKPVHFIADATDLKNVKINLMQLREIASFLYEPQLGWLIVIGGHPVARFISSIIMQLRHKNFRYTDSLEEAITILERVDPTITQAT
jgi:hypothetical protein